MSKAWKLPKRCTELRLLCRAAMLRKGQLVQAETVSEVGIYGTLVRRGGAELLNREAGHLVRTKAVTSNEGGVAAGFAVLDSPFLVD